MIAAGTSCRLVCAAALAVVMGWMSPLVAAPLAELVSMTTSDRVLLHGLHYRPARDSHSVVIHIPGGPGAFYSAQDMAPLAELLNANGWHFLSVSLRTAGANGLLYAKPDDSLQDIAAIVGFAKENGLTNIILLGYSLSSARVLHYLSQTKDPAVKGLVLSAAITSPYLEAQMRWNEAERAQYDAFLEQRREDVKAGRGRNLVSYPWGGPGRSFDLSSATWVSMFGTPQESNATTINFAGDVTIPVLIVHGTKDRTALPKNAEQIQASLVKAPMKDLVWIEGGDHLMTGHAGQYGGIVSDWVLANFRTGPVVAPGN